MTYAHTHALVRTSGVVISISSASPIFASLTKRTVASARMKGKSASPPNASTHARSRAVAEGAHDRVELGIVPHRRAHERPLIPEHAPQVGLGHRPAGGAARDEPP